MNQNGPDSTMSRFVESFARGDVEELVSLYEADAAFFGEGGVEAHGHDGLRAAFRDLFAIAPSLELTATETRVVGDLAFIANDWKLRGAAPDGTRVEKSGRSAVVLRRDSSGKWRIAIDRP